jgi:hypothetical protein
MASLYFELWMTCMGDSVIGTVPSQSVRNITRRYLVLPTNWPEPIE